MNNWKKWRAEEEERHKGLLTDKKHTKTGNIYQMTTNYTKLL
jgi:hypothetical protein